MDTDEERKSELEDRRARKKQSQVKRRRRHRHERKEDYTNFNFDIPGVIKITLGEKTQKEMGCLVGEDVTSEKPWKIIKKEMFEDHIEMSEDSEFIPIRLDIITFPKNEILIGYAPDETREYDEFYIVLADSAETKIKEVIEKIRQAQEKKLAKAVAKRARFWATLGSAAEIEEYTEKTNRPLLEVEVEAAYPIMSPKVVFKLRPVEAARDGYVELLADRLQITTILKKRIHAGIQVAPSMATSEAQTLCTYPKNAWTQYQYEFTPIESLTKELEDNIKHYLENHLEDLCDNIKVNEFINLYTNDYQDLVTDVMFTKAPGAVTWDEYMSFADLNEARNKMIASVCWHPIWTGTVVIAYSDCAANMYKRYKSTADEVNDIIHGINPVLIWCFNDGLYPKLFLESNRKVDVVSICPFNENLIVGGLSNGQIVIWDIKNKLNKVEEEEILTTAQQKYRVLMFSLMDWMKNTRDFSRVRVTAESDVRYSHTAPVTSIRWMSPYWKITRTGQICEIDEREPYTLQLATSSGDGSVLFWDLLAKPVTQAGDYKPQRKSRRLKVRPNALTLDVSPFRMLHRLLRPHYRLTTYSTKKVRPILLSCSDLLPIYVNYQLPASHKKHTITDRVAYNVIVNKPPVPPCAKLVCSSLDGYFLTIEWEGYDVNPGEAVNQEAAKVTKIGRYHDGPVICIDRNKECPNTFLTVGGKSFAVWKDDFKDRPIIWRKSRVRYLHGAWNLKNPAMLRLSRADGNREVWYLTKRTDKMVYEQSLSGSAVLGSFTHPLDNTPDVHVLGVADFNGTFRMFYVPDAFVDVTTEKEQLLFQLEREVTRKTAFLKWQDSWLMKNQHIVEEKRAKRVEKQRIREERDLHEQQRLLEEKQRLEKEHLLAAQKSVPQPGHYLEWAEQQWRIKEEDRMNKVLLMKKQLNPDLLVSQQMPLKILQQEEDRKKKKQKERLQKSDKIFSETVAMLFPDVIKKKPPPPLDPYAGGDPQEIKAQCLAEYEEVSEHCKSYISQNSFVYDFNWKNVIQSGRERRRAIDSQYTTFSHKDRHENEKTLRLQNSLDVDERSRESVGERDADDETTDKFEESDDMLD